jgi:hypothetical protein
LPGTSSVGSETGPTRSLASYDAGSSLVCSDGCSELAVATDARSSTTRRALPSYSQLNRVCACLAVVYLFFDRETPGSAAQPGTVTTAATSIMDWIN